MDTPGLRDTSQDVADTCSVYDLGLGFASTGRQMEEVLQELVVVEGEKTVVSSQYSESSQVGALALPGPIGPDGARS